MKTIIFCLVLISSLQALAMDKESAQNMFDINEKSFSQKQIINNPSLCEFHNSLIKILKNKEEMKCARAVTETKDAELEVQLKNMNQTMVIVDMQHPDSEVNMESVSDYAVKKIKSQGFNQK